MSASDRKSVTWIILYNQLISQLNKVILMKMHT